MVASPITGQVTARNAQPGLLVQPGYPPAPYAVADVSTMWMLANVAESDSPLFQRGQPVQVKVMAYPDRDSHGTISMIGASGRSEHPSVAVRSEIADPKHELRPGMLADFVIQYRRAGAATAAPRTAWSVKATARMTSGSPPTGTT